MIEAIVIEKKSDKFEVQYKNGNALAFARKNVRDDGIFVGDTVKYNESENIIEQVLPRKNLFLRPNIANLQKLFIVIAEIPKPDFKIVDKLILFALSNNVEPILCINKIDLSDELFFNKIDKAYKHVCKVVFLSAKTGQNLNVLHDLMRGNICSFAGQSAVGKSALINKIYNKNITIEGELSKKIMRGKNTTRTSKLYFLEDNTYIADTAGFSSLSEKYLPINYYELTYYYPDFLVAHNSCKYKSCSHTKENIDECCVKRFVEKGIIDKDRYKYYTEIYEILKKEWVKNHG